MYSVEIKSRFKRLDIQHVARKQGIEAKTSHNFKQIILIYIVKYSMHIFVISFKRDDSPNKGDVYNFTY